MHLIVGSNNGNTGKPHFMEKKIIEDKCIKDMGRFNSL